MEWENELKTGADFLDQHLSEVKKDGVSIKMHDWNAINNFSTEEFNERNYYKIYYVLRGKGTYHEDNGNGEIRKGTLILTPPDTIHKLISPNGMDVILISFSLQDTSHSYIQNLFNKIKRNQLYLLQDKEESASILLWISILKLVANNNPIYLKNNIDSLAITLFWSLLKDFEKEIMSRNSKQIHSSASHMIYKAKLFIIKHLAENITLQEVADHLHISERHLSRLFNQEMGQPFTTYIRKERIRKAGILLSDSNIPIKEIAQQTGFSSVHYFTNVFSNEMDMPPGKFREKFRYQNLIN